MPATPILDLQQLPPKPRPKWLLRLIAIGVGLFIAWILILGDQHRLPLWHWPGFNGLLLLPGLYVVTAFHELGHLIAGALAGVQSGGIAIGGFTWTKSGSRWAFRFHWRTFGCGFF